jgi:hypothetical protein
MDNVIRVGKKASELKGEGTEYLVIDGQVIAKFYDGNMVTDIKPVGNDEVTIASA